MTNVIAIRGNNNAENKGIRALQGKYEKPQHTFFEWQITGLTKNPIHEGDVILIAGSVISEDNKSALETAKQAGATIRVITKGLESVALVDGLLSNIEHETITATNAHHMI